MLRKVALLGMILINTLLLSGIEYPEGKSILDRIDKNMYSQTNISTSKMIVHTKRGDRTMVVKSYSEGDKNSFSEYLAPPRDAGTKMLKLEDKLWIFEPSSDRTIQLSGNMLRQSVMGSDLSYEDFMEETKLQDMYKATVTGEDTLNGKICWIVDLKAVNEDVAYSRRILWVDKESYLPMKEERYAKSGKLLKTAVINEVMTVEGRYYPKSMTFKDELKKGEGTELVIDEISFDAKIPEFYFTKGALKK